MTRLNTWSLHFELNTTIQFSVRRKLLPFFSQHTLNKEQNKRKHVFNYFDLFINPFHNLVSVWFCVFHCGSKTD